MARVWQVWDSIPVPLSRENKKLVWGAVREGARAKDFEIALQWLLDYGVAGQVQRVTKPSVPLSAYVERNAFKLFTLDVGLLGAMAALDVAAILQPDQLFREFKGSLTEQYVYQELVSQSAYADNPSTPYYWAGSAAEIDFVMQFSQGIVPIEVKAAENLQSQSLRSYRQKFGPIVAVRTSLSKYREENTLVNVPLYAIGEVAGIIKSVAQAH